jgi:predicted nucleotidyltransferase
MAEMTRLVGGVINMKTQIEEIKQKILPILQLYGAKRAGLFGSYVRGEMREDSDIDILVEIEKDISLLDFVGLKLQIEEILGKKVDLVEYNTIKPLLRDSILNEQVIIV